MKKVLVICSIIVSSNAYSQSYSDTYQWVVQKIIKYGNCSTSGMHPYKQWDVNIDY